MHTRLPLKQVIQSSSASSTLAGIARAWIFFPFATGAVALDVALPAASPFTDETGADLSPFEARASFSAFFAFLAAFLAFLSC